MPKKAISAAIQQQRGRARAGSQAFKASSVPPHHVPSTQWALVGQGWLGRSTGRTHGPGTMTQLMSGVINTPASCCLNLPSTAFIPADERTSGQVPGCLGVGAENTTWPHPQPDLAQGPLSILLITMGTKGAPPSDCPTLHLYQHNPSYRDPWTARSITEIKKAHEVLWGHLHPSQDKVSATTQNSELKEGRKDP